MSLQGSNNKDIPTYLQALPPVKQQASNRSTTFVLGQLKTSQPRQHLPILQLSAKVYVGGYIAHVLGEKMECENCHSITTKHMSNQTLQQLVHYQDRGRLIYPSDELMYALNTLRELVEMVETGDMASECQFSTKKCVFGTLQFQNAYLTMIHFAKFHKLPDSNYVTKCILWTPPWLSCIAAMQKVRKQLLSRFFTCSHAAPMRPSTACLPLPYPR